MKITLLMETPGIENRGRRHIGSALEKTKASKGVRRPLGGSILVPSGNLGS